MQEFIAWFINALVCINWFEIIRTLAPVATALIAYTALKNWQRQDKARRETEFIDSLIEAAHTYIVEMPKPVTLLQLAKIAMDSHTRSWGNGDANEKAIAGAIAYIEKEGERDSKRLLDCLETIKPSVIKLRSLAAKGQVFGFKDYATCQNAVDYLTWHFDRIEAFSYTIGSTSVNWDNPEVRKQLVNGMAIDPDEIRKSIADNDVTLIAFARNSYAKNYF